MCLNTEFSVITVIRKLFWCSYKIGPLEISSVEMRYVKSGGGYQTPLKNCLPLEKRRKLYKVYPVPSSCDMNTGADQRRFKISFSLEIND